MKHKTSELTGALLDTAVAKAEGLVNVADDPPAWLWPDGSYIVQDDWAPSSNWKHGGPIIEREEITISAGRTSGICEAPCWSAFVGYAKLRDPGWIECGGLAAWHPGGALAPPPSLGPTPLIAAMRAYVASKLGHTIDL